MDPTWGDASGILTWWTKVLGNIGAKMLDGGKQVQFADGDIIPCRPPPEPKEQRAWKHMLRNALRGALLRVGHGRRDMVGTQPGGIHWDGTLRLLRSLGPWQQQTILLMLLTGAFRTGERSTRWSGASAEKALCTYCGELDTMPHLLWECPRWHRLQRGQLPDHHELPICVRERGILPSGGASGEQDSRDTHDVCGDHDQLLRCTGGLEAAGYRLKRKTPASTIVWGRRAEGEQRQEAAVENHEEDPEPEHWRFIAEQEEIRELIPSLRKTKHSLQLFAMAAGAAKGGANALVCMQRLQSSNAANCFGSYPWQLHQRSSGLSRN